MTEKSITCPDCSGNGVANALVLGEIRAITCSRCEGAGVVSGEMLEWIAKGKLLRKRRLPYRSLVEEAIRLGISVTTLSKMERGALCPDSVFIEENQP